MIKWLRRLIAGDGHVPEPASTDDARLKQEIHDRQHEQTTRLHVLEWQADVEGRRKQKGQ